MRPHFGPHTKAADVAYADIDRLHRKITAAGHPYAANRTLSLLSKMFTLAVRWEMATANPAKNVEKNLELKRKRYLSGDELGRLIAALSEHPNQQSANIFRVLMMTGARRGEVLSMRWDQVDLATGTWTKLASSTKQKADHIVPLSAPVRQLLSEIRAKQREGEFVFPDDAGGPRRDIDNGWRKICKAAGITGLRVHDLRHSFASQLASGGASLPLIGALLGHADPTTTARYAHLFQDPAAAGRREGWCCHPQCWQGRDRSDAVQARWLTMARSIPVALREKLERGSVLPEGTTLTSDECCSLGGAAGAAASADRWII